MGRGRHARPGFDPKPLIAGTITAGTLMGMAPGAMAAESPTDMAQQAVDQAAEAVAQARSLPATSQEAQAAVD